MLAHCSVDAAEWGAPTGRACCFHPSSGGGGGGDVSAVAHHDNFSKFPLGHASSTYHHHHHHHHQDHRSLHLKNLSQPLSSHTMAWHSPSLFEEGFVDPREPMPADLVLQPLPVFSATSRTSFGGFRPLMSNTQAPPIVTTPTVALAKIEGSLSLPTPSVLSDPVDASQYDVLHSQDWARASVDYESSSPTPSTSMSEQPLTPDAFTYGSFLDYYVASGRHLTNPVAMRCLKQGEDDLERQYQPSLTLPQVRFAGVNHPHEHMPVASYVTDTRLHDSAQPHPAWPPAALDWGRAQLQHGHAQAARSQTLTTSPPSQVEEDHEPLSSHRSISVESADHSSLSEAVSSPAPESRATGELPYESRDDLLWRMRQEGMPYAEIKRRFGFHEAESTLRGRVRTFKTPSEHRVRKPTWEAQDVELLLEAEKHFYVDEGYQNKAKTYRKVPWTKVAEWMRVHGASYPFAPGTCAKKFAEVERQQRLAGKRESASRKRGRSTRQKRHGTGE